MANKKRSKGDPKLAERCTIAVGRSGINQRKLAAKIGVSAQSVNKWCKFGTISREHVVPFCDACGVSIRWLLTGQGAPTDRGLSTPEDVLAAAEALPLAWQLRLERDLFEKTRRPLDVAG